MLALLACRWCRALRAHSVPLPHPSIWPQHFTSLRTLLLAGNNIDAPVDAFGDEFGVEQQHPQGVPLALSALRQLEELDLRGNYFVRQMPQVCVGQRLAASRGACPGPGTPA